MHIFLQRTRVMFMPQRYPKHRMEDSKLSALESCMQEPVAIDVWGAAPERWTHYVQPPSIVNTSLSVVHLFSRK